MFKFNFDVEDDSEQTTDSLHENRTTQNHDPPSAQTAIPDTFTELFLADAVCMIVAHLRTVNTDLGARIS